MTKIFAKKNLDCLRKFENLGREKNVEFVEADPICKLVVPLQEASRRPSSSYAWWQRWEWWRRPARTTCSRGRWCCIKRARAKEELRSEKESRDTKRSGSESQWQFWWQNNTPPKSKAAPKKNPSQNSSCRTADRCANKTKDFLSMYPSYFIFSFTIFLFSFSFSFPMCPIFSLNHFRYTQTPSRSRRQALSNASSAFGC